MKSKFVIIILLWLLSANAFAQKSKPSHLSGIWINAQYDQFKNSSQKSDLLFKISPWYINIDTSGRCDIVLLYEQKADIGYPKIKSHNGTWEYHYKKKHDVFLYTIKDNDSLLVYSNGNTPGAGIIFKKIPPMTDNSN